MKQFIKILVASLFIATPAMADMPMTGLFNLTYADAEEAANAALVQKGYGTLVGTTITGRKMGALFSYDKPITSEIRGLQADKDKKQWSGNLVIISDGNVISAMPLAGRYSELVELPVLRRQVRNGEVISESEVEMRRFALERTSSDVIADASSIIGKSPLRSISPARPIHNNEIAAAAVIKKNAMVQMRYKTATMEITTTGQVLTDGAAGEVIAVKNLASKRTVHAVVVDASTVDVMTQGVQTSQLELPTGVAAHAKQ